MPTLAEEILADSPTGYWKLDELSGTKAANSAVKAKNLMSYGSFEGATKSGIAEWTGATLTMQQGSPAQGTYCARVDTAASIGSGISVGSQALDPTMYPEGTYNFGASIALKGAAGGEPVNVWIRAQLDNTATQDGATVSPVLTTGWTRVAAPQATVVVPSGRYIKYLFLMVRTRTATACTFYADAAIQTEGTSAPATYFDGATPGCSWDGTADASTSTRDLDGTYTNSPTLGVAGYAQGGDLAASLDGIDDYAPVGGAAIPLADTFTFEAWAKPTAAGSIIGRAAQQIVRINAANKIELLKGSTVIATSTNALAAGWHHIVVTKDAGTVAMYVDGSAVATTAGTAQTFSISTADLCVGSTGASDYLAASIQHAAIYPTALSASRVAAHCLAGRTALAQSVITAQSVLTSPIHADSPMSADITATSATTAGISPDIPVGQTNLIALSDLSAAPRATVGLPFTLVGARDDYLTLEGADAS